MRAASLASLAALSLTACPLFGEQEQRPVEEKVATDPQQFTERVDYKLRRYEACRADAAEIVREGWARYTDQVSAKGRPRHARVYLRGIEESALRTCRRTMTSVPQAQPKLLTIDAGAEAMFAATAIFAAQTRAVSSYIEDGAWREDDWAGLPRLDRRLREAHANWMSSDLELQAAIDVRHFENDPLLLGILEQRRGPLELASRSAMIHARPMLRCMVQDPPPTQEDCAAAFDTFDRAYASFERVYSADLEAASRVFWMETFASDLKDFQALAAASLRELSPRRGRPAADLSELSDAYSALARDAETLDFAFP